MLRTGDKKRKGQALVMITMSLIAMCGVMGLAVDLGWSYFVRKSAQRAADSAAMAAAGFALQQVGQGALFTCGASKVACQAISSCPASPPSPPGTDIDDACLYAKQNGFTFGGSGGQQNVTIAADVTNPVPTAPGITVDYWATARVTQNVPQLFSAVIRFPWAQVSARATAAVIDVAVPGTVYMLDRENDASPNGKGVDLHMGGGGSLTVAGGMYMASGAAGGKYATAINGSATAVTAYTSTRGQVDQPSAFTPAAAAGQSDGVNFQDPMQGKGQPPPPTQAQAPDTGGTPSGNLGGGSGCTNLSPGTYYATSVVKGKTVASGAPLNLSGCINFTSGSSGFGNYVFFGGLNFNGGTFTFGPGRYILAGAQSGNSIVSAGNGNIITDNTPMSGGNSVANIDAGEMFVFTDANYTAQGTAVYVPPMVSAVQPTLGFSSIDINMGNDTSSSYVNLHGLNTSNANLPPELKPFAPDVWWQDQANSPILYNPDGTINTTACLGGSINSPCANPSAAKTSPDINFQAHPNTWLYGMLYQPRGASLNFQGHGGLNSPMMIITGSISLQGSPMVLQPYPGNPLVRRQAALVE